MDAQQERKIFMDRELRDIAGFFARKRTLYDNGRFSNEFLSRYQDDSRFTDYPRGAIGAADTCWTIYEQIKENPRNHTHTQQTRNAGNVQALNWDSCDDEEVDNSDMDNSDMDIDDEGNNPPPIARRLFRHGPNSLFLPFGGNNAQIG